MLGRMIKAANHFGSETIIQGSTESPFLFYNNIKMSQQNVSDIILDDYSADYTNIYKDYDITKNITGNKMTKYEYTKVLGMRAQQITMGAEPLIKISNDMKSAIEVAEEELRQRKTPYIIARKINKKKTDFWKIEDMIIEVI